MALAANDELGRIGWLRDALPEFRAAMLALAVPRGFEDGQVMWQAGESGVGIIGIRKGAAGMLHALARASAPVAHLCGPGFWIGQGPFLANLPLQTTLVARGAVSAVIVSRQPLLTLLADRGDYWRELGRLTLDHSLAAVTIANDLMIPNSRQRLAATLLRLAGCRFAGAPAGTLTITQSEIAAMANLSRHSASPILAEFAAAGFIAAGYRTLTVRDAARLRALVDAD
jgi:CRP/FNR family cyclic AMP-dependent transcriptional regulator